MSLGTVYDYIEEFSSIKGKGSQALKNQKFKEFSKNKLFLKTIKYALEPRMSFGIEEFDSYEGPHPDASVAKVFKYLDFLNSKRGVKESEKEVLRNYASVDEKTYETVRRIVMGNLGIGMAAKTINKILGYMFIYRVPYMRCHTTINGHKRIRFPAYAQVKEDGGFLNCFTGDDPRFETREGRRVEIPHLLKKIVACSRKRVHTGEILVVSSTGVVWPRAKSNGILNKVIQGTASEDELRMLTYKIWDSVEETKFWEGVYNVSYSARRKETKNIVDSINNRLLVDFVEDREVKSWKEIHEFYYEIRKRKPKKEGLVVKNTNGIWKDHDSWDQQKYVNISPADLRIVGWDYGTKHKRLEHVLGKLHLRSDDGLVEVSIGQFPDSFRNQPKEELNMLIQKICAINYKELCKSELSEGMMSLYLPRYDTIRLDKDETDTLDDLLNR